jgi:uncharacterized protein (DUF4415 family)
MSGRGRKQPAGFDEENPEWTARDFARARSPREALSPEVLSAFKKTRGPQRAPKKVAVSIRLSADVVDHFRATGRGWQGRIDAMLKKAMSRRR